MSKIEEEVKQNRFPNEQVKAQINLLFTANWLYNKLSSFLKNYDLTHEQFNVLRILRGSHPKSMCQKDILDRMIAPNSNMTKIIKKLKEKELIQVANSEVDKRHYIINITDPGLALLSEIDEPLRKEGEKLYGLNISEAFHLNALLDKLRDI